MSAATVAALALALVSPELVSTALVAVLTLVVVLALVVALVVVVAIEDEDRAA